MRQLAPFLSLFLASAALARPPTPKELFLSGTASFAGGNYTAAERQFLACRRALGDNAAVDFNLAMTSLRLEELGRARVYLERAQRLAPRDRALADQLRGLYARLDTAAPPSPSWLHAMWDAARTGLTYPEALALATVIGLAAAGLIGTWLLTDRRRWGLAALVMSAAAVLMGSVALAKLAEALGPPRAIVVAESASVRGGPGGEFGEIGRLSEGVDVRLLERPQVRFGPGPALRVTREDQGLWCEVRAPSGMRGYVRRSLLEPI